MLKEATLSHGKTTASLQVRRPKHGTSRTILQAKNPSQKESSFKVVVTRSKLRERCEKKKAAVKPENAGFMAVEVTHLAEQKRQGRTSRLTALQGVALAS